MEPRCVQCGYDLRATDRDAACPECGLSVEASWVTPELEVGGWRYDRQLQRGLVCLAAALCLMPVIPLVTVGILATGRSMEHAAPLVFFAVCVLVLVEHVLWLLGVIQATGFAAARPHSRPAARAARIAAGVNLPAAALCLLLYVIAFAGRDRVVAAYALAGTVMLALAARGVTLVLGTVSLGAALRVLGVIKTINALMVVSGLGGLGIVVTALGTLVSALWLGLWRTPLTLDLGSWMLAIGISMIWLAGLAGGVVCTVVAVQTTRRLATTQ